MSACLSETDELDKYLLCPSCVPGAVLGCLGADSPLGEVDKRQAMMKNVISVCIGRVAGVPGALVQGIESSPGGSGKSPAGSAADELETPWQKEVDG